MDSPVVVAGVVNVQQTIPVEGFPVAYAPVRYLPHGLRLATSGVGLNVARALTGLGRPVRLATVVGRDGAGVLVRDALEQAGLAGAGVVGGECTAQSAVLVDRAGRRQISTDLKDLPLFPYPLEVFAGLLVGAQAAAVSTIGFARRLLPVAVEAGVPIAVDLQATPGLQDTYARDWVERATVVFCSQENLTVSPERFARDVFALGRAKVVVVGLGAAGCVRFLPGMSPRAVPAVAPFGVRDTTGAGDALFAGFLHYWLRSGDPDDAIDRAVLVAGWTVGFPGTGHYPTHDDIVTLRSRTR
ncbi:sugar kinase [Frankia sp. CcI49]|uniref:carbohydrate kinase family protein n=1 Tax=unclassified Frankia TaxID=2632575 RepID=UPI0006CA52AD|nr:MULTISPECIES: carbohydrate kinase family protein [unclassified Frankia]KPM51630.1 sugar kinase [Frankia sp. R43]ONH59253.1 sugar kinase [Frankia sp. CcI49]